MSGDPFANTTTVKNILQHIISPKLVIDGSGGYVSKTDLVNVHNIVFAAGASNEDGTVAHPFTKQTGVFTTDGDTQITVNHSRVTADSIVLAQNLDSNSLLVTSVNATSGSFTINFSSNSSGYKIGWFISKF